MTATKKKQQSKPSGGTLMSMRSGFQKVVGTDGKKKKAAASDKWSFQKVFLLVAVGAVLIAVFYAFTHR